MIEHYVETDKSPTSAKQRNALQERENLDLAAIYSQELQEVFGKLDTAFRNFFEDRTKHPYTKKQISSMACPHGGEHGHELALQVPKVMLNVKRYS